MNHSQALNAPGPTRHPPAPEKISKRAGPWQLRLVISSIAMHRIQTSLQITLSSSAFALLLVVKMAHTFSRKATDCR
jgi:hypothetical protein